LVIQTLLSTAGPVLAWVAGGVRRRPPNARRPAASWSSRARSSTPGSAPALAACLALTSALAFAPGADARPRQLSLRPGLDASVRADAPRARLGRLGLLRVDGRPRARALLRFRVPGLRGRVVGRASVRLYVWRGARRGIRAGATRKTRWSERRVSWLRAPAPLAPVASSVPAGGRWVSIDVTPLVHGGVVDLALTSAGARASVIASREARRFAPRLLVRHLADRQPRFPIRAAFYSTAFPEAWSERGARYHPSQGRYETASKQTVGAHLRAMRWGGVRPHWSPGTGAGPRATCA
jgi:hypothetical protein